MYNERSGRWLVANNDINRFSEDYASLPFPISVYIISVITPISISLGGLNITLLRLYLMLILIPVFLSFVRGKYGRLQITDFLFGLHTVWVMIALAINNPNMVLTQVGTVGIEFFGGYLVGRAYIRTPEAFAALCRWVVFIVLCSLPFAILETQTGNPIIIETIEQLPGVSSAPNNNRDPRLGLERAQVMLAHPIHYGLFCSVAFSLAFVALKDFTSPTRRYVISCIVMLSGFLALSSGALLAIFLQLFLILWAALFDKMRWRWWLLLGLGCLAYIVIDILSNRSPVVAVLSRLTFSSHNLYWRTIIFEWGMKNVWDNPIYGIGLNDWERPHYMHSGSMDNFWLVMAVRYGIPGFLLLALGYAFGLFRVMRRNFDGDPVLLNFRRAWVFTFLGLSFTLATVHVWTNIYSFVFFMFGAGMWFITAAPRSGSASGSATPSESRGRLPYTRFAGPKETEAELP